MTPRLLVPGFFIIEGTKARRHEAAKARRRTASRVVPAAVDAGIIHPSATIRPPRRENNTYSRIVIAKHPARKTPNNSDFARTNPELLRRKRAFFQLIFSFCAFPAPSRRRFAPNRAFLSANPKTPRSVGRARPVRR